MRVGSRFKISTSRPPILNFWVDIRVRFKIRVRFSAKDRVKVRMVFRVKVQGYISIKRGGFRNRVRPDY